MQILQIAEVQKYIDRLSNDNNECEVLFNELLINVTSFFRDPESHLALREVLSELIDR